MGTEHLIACGHKNIGFISGPRRIETAAERVSGHDETIPAARLRPLVAFGNFPSR
jgi:LacI family transcriptional regulator